MIRIAFILLLSFTHFQDKDKKAKMLCKNWGQIGQQYLPEGSYKDIPSNIARKITFNDNGTYSEIYGANRASGYWKFNSDSTKFLISYETYNDEKVQNDFNLKYYFPILKLNEDTLVFSRMDRQRTVKETYIKQLDK